MTGATKAAHTKKHFAYCTIGEAAKDLDLPQHVLRFWETKFKQIKPLKRKGGHRYYSPEDVAFLKEVKNLLHEKGFTIKGAQKYLDEHDRVIKEAVSEALASQHDLFSAIKNIESKEEAASPKASEEKNKAFFETLYNELKSIQHLIKQEITSK